MDTKVYDVLIVGAGAAGMMAALEIALAGKTVVVVEAGERSGGRMFTIDAPEFEKPVELGAEFVHGNLPVTLGLFEKAGIEKLESTGEVWGHKNGKLEQQKDFIKAYDELVEKFQALRKDLSVADFINQYLQGDRYNELRASLKNYVQGYYAGDMNRASTYALYEELTAEQDINYRVEGGYKKLAFYLEKQCRQNGVQFYFSEEVQEVHWQPLDVKVRSKKQTIQSRKIILTASVGVLQSNTISFSPSLPEKQTAFKQLGFGHVIKINVAFTEPFWSDKTNTGEQNLSKLNFLFSDEIIPTWWTQHPQKDAMLVGWLGGPPSEQFRTASKEEIVANAVKSLATIFSVEPSFIKNKLRETEWYNWSADKHFCGAYSYNVVNGEALIKSILSPVKSTLYFAGEGLYPGSKIGTVEAALSSGRAIGRQVVDEF